MDNPNNPTCAHHTQTYGRDFAYDAFVGMFTAAKFGPVAWALLPISRAAHRGEDLPRKDQARRRRWHSARAAGRLIDPYRDPIDVLPAERGVSVVEQTGHESALEWFAAELPGLLAAIARAAETGSDRHAWQPSWAIAYFMERRGKWERWAAATQTAPASAQRLFKAAGDLAGQARVHFDLCWIHDRRGEHRQALDAAEQALRLTQEIGDRFGEADTWDTLGAAHLGLGRPQQSVACYEHATTLYRELGHRFGEAGTITRLGDAHHASGTTDAATDAWRRAVAILDDLGHPDAESVRAKLGKG